jgi:hypothetical protein
VYGCTLLIVSSAVLSVLPILLVVRVLVLLLVLAELELDLVVLPLDVDLPLGDELLEYWSRDFSCLAKIPSSFMRCDADG